MGELKRVIVKLDGGSGARWKRSLSTIEIGNILPQTLVSTYEARCEGKGEP